MRHFDLFSLRLVFRFYKIYFQLGVVLTVVGAAGLGGAQAQAVFTPGKVQAPVCSAKKMKEILAPANQQKVSVLLDCSPVLDRQSKITKRLLLKGQQASGITIDCNGGLINGGSGTPNHNKDMILIQSIQGKAGRWFTPSNIIVRNCEIRGSIRIFGMDTNGEGKTVRASSRMPGHTKRARDAAPSHIWLDNIFLIGQGRIPLYISPGTTHVTLTNSTLGGKTDSTAIYMDAESAFNLVLNNRIETQTSVRELIALDGSSHNKFIGNQFSSLSHGGIYVYRNCGEGGTIRHATPSYNQILNNSFYYDKFPGFNLNLEMLADMKLSFETPAIWIASRNGGKSYCDADKGYDLGSSKDDRDFARNNVIAYNQIFKLSPAKMIVINDQPNVVLENSSVSNRINRKSSCYMDEARGGFFFPNGTQVQAPRIFQTERCRLQTFVCNDGLVQRVPGTCVK